LGFSDSVVVAGEHDGVGEAVGGDDPQDPVELIAHLHCRRDAPQRKYRYSPDSRGHKVGEDGDDLGRALLLEAEGGRVGEGHDRQGEQQEHPPHLLIFQTKKLDESNGDYGGDVGLGYVKEEVADPISAKVHSRENLQMLELLFLLIDDVCDY